MMVQHGSRDSAGSLKSSQLFRLQNQLSAALYHICFAIVRARCFSFFSDTFILSLSSATSLKFKSERIVGHLMSTKYESLLLDRISSSDHVTGYKSPLDLVSVEMFICGLGMKMLFSDLWGLWRKQAFGKAHELFSSTGV